MDYSVNVVLSHSPLSQSFVRRMLNFFVPLVVKYQHCAPNIKIIGKTASLTVDPTPVTDATPTSTTHKETSPTAAIPPILSTSSLKSTLPDALDAADTSSILSRQPANPAPSNIANLSNSISDDEISNLDSSNFASVTPSTSFASTDETLDPHPPTTPSLRAKLLNRVKSIRSQFQHHDRRSGEWDGVGSRASPASTTPNTTILSTTPIHSNSYNPEITSPHLGSTLHSSSSVAMKPPHATTTERPPLFTTKKLKMAAGGLVSRVHESMMRRKGAARVVDGENVDSIPQPPPPSDHDDI